MLMKKKTNYFEKNTISFSPNPSTSYFSFSPKNSHFQKLNFEK